MTGTNFLTIASAGGESSVRVWVVYPAAQANTEPVKRAGCATDIISGGVEAEGRQSYNISDFTDIAYNTGGRTASLQKRFVGSDGTGTNITALVIQCSTDAVSNICILLSESYSISNSLLL